MSIKTTIARPYAKAAFATAVEHGTVRAWTDLLNTAAWVTTRPNVEQYLHDPRFSSQQQYEWFVDVCAPVLNEEGRHFFRLLAHNKRLVLIPEIASLFEAYRIEQEKTMSVQVFSPYPLNEGEQRRLADALKKKLHCEVMLNCQEDKSILGGMIIQAGDLVIDSSVRGKLMRLEALLTS